MLKIFEDTDVDKFNIEVHTAKDGTKFITNKEYYDIAIAADRYFLDCNVNMTFMFDLYSIGAYSSHDKDNPYKEKICGAITFFDERRDIDSRLTCYSCPTFEYIENYANNILKCVNYTREINNKLKGVKVLKRNISIKKML